MNLFFMLSGIIFWIFFFTACFVWMLMVCDDLIKSKLKSKADLAEGAAYSDIGRAIFSNAYWLGGDEYKDIHPYVLMKYLGEEIRDHGYFTWTIQKRAEVVSRSSLYNRSNHKE